MKALSSASFTPPPPGEGLIQRVANAIRNVTADSPPTLQRLAARLGIGKVKTTAAAPDAPQVPERPANKVTVPAAPPAPFMPEGLTASEIEEWQAMESYLSNLPNEEARDAYVTSLVASIKATIKASATPPATMRHADFLRMPYDEANAFMREGGRLAP